MTDTLTGDAATTTYTAEPVSAIDLQPGWTFERHGRLWTVEDVVRGPYGCVHVLTAGGGHVFVPKGGSVGVRTRSVS